MYAGNRRGILPPLSADRVFRTAHHWFGQACPRNTGGLRCRFVLSDLIILRRVEVRRLMKYPQGKAERLEFLRDEGVHPAGV
jgi:hypothetical protein